MNTLLDLTSRMRQLGSREAIRWSNGLRRWMWTYADLCGAAGAFSNWLDAQGIGKGDRIMIWGENRGEWIAVFWGSTLTWRRACSGRFSIFSGTGFAHSP